MAARKHPPRPKKMPNFMRKNAVFGKAIQIIPGKKKPEPPGRSDRPLISACLLDKMGEGECSGFKWKGRKINNNPNQPQQAFTWSKEKKEEFLHRYNENAVKKRKY